MVSGLLAGLFLQDVALLLKGFLPPMIAALLFLAAFRIGPFSVMNELRGIRTAVQIVAAYQLLAPLAVALLFLSIGMESTTVAIAIILTLAAPSVTGSPNFTILMGQRPESALRLLLFGTMIFPFSALPVLLLLPALSAADVMLSALRLAGVVVATVGTAFLLRRYSVQDITDRGLQAIDGASAVLLGLVVVGLMSAVGPLLLTDPILFTGWLAIAFALNFGAQVLAWLTIARSVPDDQRAGVSLVAGNRNIALFLVALPTSLSDALLVFIGCYQIPMYLTPLLMARLYGGRSQRSD
ncbi:MAG: hypothetical protein QNJ35_17695 [Paracoccaceae bacterium]|nr:hypothetical protein [Paracoccaceae bacterium]